MSEQNELIAGGGSCGAASLMIVGLLLGLIFVLIMM